MGIKLRLTVMNFLEFFVWGAWLISLGGYMFNALHFTGTQIGAIYGTMGIASIFTPALFGIVADRWINAERVLGICHVVGAASLLWASTLHDFNTFYLAMLLNSAFFMPTIALNNTVSYIILEKRDFNIVKDFPPIRVWGTVGFVCAMWLVDLSGSGLQPAQLYISAGAGIFLGIYAFTMPPCAPVPNMTKRSFASSLGLDAFVLFKNRKMLIFFVYSMLLGFALQISNAFADGFINDFAKVPEYAQSFGVRHSVLLISISQISETLFILTIPFFLRRFGIKQVIIMSIFAWVFRFGLFGFGNPGAGLPLLVLSMIVYGMAFDFFNISGSLFVEREADIKIRASAQGLFMLMTNGFGAWIGTYISGRVVDHYTTNGIRDWHSIWISFAAYALVLGITFPLVFRYKHDPATATTAFQH
ncbi:MAG TPA: nucleoside permease [Puia sp.]|uniref:nucleoside permease n=1 Tax=Puia sp. TaxID=2045100 RepID=UPI002C94807D|nr:nucleoside permease [Puia sp.]HVU97893.1 nucleoside permease [Puia sp.]